MTPVRPLRAAAVIVASKPLDPADAVEGFGGERGRMLPAMIRAGQVTFIERVIIRFQLAGAAPIIVITGFENDRLERHLARMSVVCLNQSGWKESTVFDDAMLGLRYVERSCRGCEKVLLTTPLIPSVKEETLAALLDSTEAIAVPVYEGIEGLPLAIRRELISEIPLKAPGKNLADLAGWSPGQPEKIEVGDQGILTRLDGRDAIADLEFLQGEKHGLPMRVRLKLNLARESVFFGPGPATLLRLIDETGSVRTACVRMKLSYSKGWQILNLLEEELGAVVVERKPGGQEGGSSKLTAVGLDLLHRYEQLTSETQKSVNQLFDQIFGDFPQKKA